MSALPPDGRLVSFYGDDFTGSTAVMEVLTFAGLPTVLFLDAPTPERLARFAGYRGVGIAGVARSQSPAWMDEHLPPVFRALAELEAPVAHYKVCSTFDSAPQVGSIGRAIDLAAPILGGAWHPLVVAAPADRALPGLRQPVRRGRTASATGSTATRRCRATRSRRWTRPTSASISRSRPARPIGLVDFVAMKRGEGDEALERERAAGAEIVALDVIDEETPGRGRAAGLGEPRRAAVRRRLAGVEYALVAHWRAAGLIPKRACRPAAPSRSSGSPAFPGRARR